MANSAPAEQLRRLRRLDCCALSDAMDRLRLIGMRLDEARRQFKYDNLQSRHR